MDIDSFYCIICKCCCDPDFTYSKDVCAGCAGISTYDNCTLTLYPVSMVKIEEKISSTLEVYNPLRPKIDCKIIIDEIANHGQFRNFRKYNKLDCQVSARKRRIVQ